MLDTSSQKRVITTSNTTSGIGLRSLEAGEIIYYKVNVGSEPSGMLPCRVDSGVVEIL
jgi:hypothetical protein